MATSLLSTASLTPGMAILTSLGLVFLGWNPCMFLLLALLLSQPTFPFPFPYVLPTTLHPASSQIIISEPPCPAVI